nr:myosin light chain kinase family member 4-like [Odocoileus virginianus texanus]
MPRARRRFVNHSATLQVQIGFHGVRGRSPRTLVVKTSSVKTGTTLGPPEPRQAKERVWPLPGLKDAAPAADDRTVAPAVLLEYLYLIGFGSSSLRTREALEAQPLVRRVSSVKAAPPSRAVGKAGTRPILQKADPTEASGGGKRRGGEESLVQEENKKSKIDAAAFSSRLPADAPAPPAPFDHRIVTARQAAVNSFYTVSRTEILGGGRFGQVHKCEEKATGLKLAAKIIKTRGVKDKDDVRNEISVMNQLDHVNLIQLYDAFESKNDIVLVMEYVDGGELFDRIIDDNCSLTEFDTILFIRQICEGIRHMHQMYILHLDLKPENILCVNRDTKQIKIIDFGLARRYKPREKLKVNFGTPEFLAPEVVNYDFVSFPTDMWSVGVITYMLLSGLSPFLGDDDAETLNNILACRWDLEDQEFQDVSEEAREFISKLLIKEKSWRISASEALKHPWLSDHKLHSRLRTQKRKNCCSDAQDLVTK